MEDESTEFQILQGQSQIEMKDRSSANTQNANELTKVHDNQILINVADEKRGSKDMKDKE